MARTLAERMAALDADRFVGRRRELEWLEALVAARQPSPSVVLVHGPGGIGKSALLREPWADGLGDDLRNPRARRARHDRPRGAAGGHAALDRDQRGVRGASPASWSPSR
jgi:hypothetical protein